MSVNRGIRASFENRWEKFWKGFITTFIVTLSLFAFSPLYLRGKKIEETWYIFLMVFCVGLLITIIWAFNNIDLERKMNFYIELDDELEKRGKSKEQREKIKKIVMKEDEDEERKSNCWWDDFDCWDF